MTKFALILAALCLMAFDGSVDSLEAQTAYFTGVTTTLIANGVTAPSGVAVDSVGNVFVADTANNQVKEVLAAGGYTTVKVLSGSFFHPMGIAMDRSDNVFVTDASNNSVKEMLAADGYATVTTLVSGLGNLRGIAVDSADNVFVVDASSSTVKKFSTADRYATAITLGSGFSGPTGVAVDASGNVFVADYGNGVIEKILAIGGYTTISTLGAFGGPSGVAVDAAGNVFVADTDNNQVKEILAAGGYTTITTLGGGFDHLLGVAVDGRGNIFVADTKNNAVKEIMTQGVNLGTANIATGTPLTAALSFTFLTSGTIDAPSVLTLGSPGQDFTDLGTGDTCMAANVQAGDTCTINVAFTPKVSGARTGAVTLSSSGAVVANTYLYGTGLGPQLTFSQSTRSELGGELFSPGGVALDGHGNIFLADTGNDAVAEIVAAGEGYSTFISLGDEFSSPGGVAVDGSGNLFVADAGNDAVKEILAADGYSTVLTIGSGFASPLGVAVDSFGNVFVADSGNNAVKEILAAGGYTTTQSLGNGFSYPTGVAVDAIGNVFVADSGNDAVKEIAASGGYTTVTQIGSGFAAPNGIALDGSGNVFVADSGNNQVKEILAAGGYATMNTLSVTFSKPLGVAVDGGGNVFVADSGNDAVAILDFVDPPSLDFGSTSVGSTSNDSPQVVTLNNRGNAALAFSAPGLGLNPIISSGFTFNDNSTCPQVSSSSPAATLPAGSSCMFSVSFTPTTGGAITGGMVIQDNDLNATAPGYTTQRITLNGTATATATSPTVVFNVPDHVYGDAPFTVSATSNSTGAFTYSVVSGPATIAGSSVSLTGAGTVVLLASEAADVNYAASGKNATFTVAGATPSITFHAPNHQYGDSPFVISATSNSTGAFTYSVVSGPATIAGATVTLIGAGQVVLQAVEAADGNYSAGSAGTSFTVASAIVLTATANTATAAPGSPSTFTLTVTPGGATTFSNALKFTVSGLPDGYTASFAPATLPAGSAGAQVTLTIQTPTSAANAKKQSPGAPFASIALAFLVLPLFGIRSGRALLRKVASRPIATVFLLLSMSALLDLTGCGSGVFLTPHKYDVVISATDSLTNASATAEVGLIVQ